MNKNKFLGILYVVLFLIIITSAYAATKPISGYVNMTGNAAANNASVIVKIRYNESFMGTDYPCNCSTSPAVYSGSDGSYSTNLNNLIFTETCFGGNNVAGNNCNGKWSAGNLIWTEADGSTVIPSLQGNGTTENSDQTVNSGSGLQTLSNVSLAEGPDNNPPVVSLIGPVNNYANNTGSVMFKYNVTDTSLVGNCSLIFNATINTTDNSITKNIDQNFTISGFKNGHYNWTINCTDAKGNYDNAGYRLLNISRVGKLITSLIIPTSSTTKERHYLFEFTSQVICLDGTCGNITAGLDPIDPEKNINTSLWGRILGFLKKFFGTNSITGMAAGSLVPTSVTTPFYVNGSNPLNSSSGVSCLNHMVENSACNVTWYVNASGDVGIKREFFVIYNSSTYNTLGNESSRINITISDSVKPNIFNMTPKSGTNYHVGNTSIEVAANVTDNFKVDSVLANITYPNSSVIQYRLTNDSNYVYKFNMSLTVPAVIGTYTIKFIANDTSNNINSSETTFFIGVDQIKPNVTNILPTSGKSYNISDIVQIAANVTDNIAVNSVLANITLPNSSISQLTLSKQGSTFKYNYSYTVPNLKGRYDLKIIANDSSNNLNTTETTFFVGNDSIVPAVLNLTPIDGSNQEVSDSINLGVNVTDNSDLSVVFVNVTYPNNSIIRVDLLQVTGMNVYNVSFSVPALLGQHSLHYFANDSSNNINQTETSTFNAVDTTLPKVFNLTPSGGSFAINNSFEIGANLTDLFNLTFTKVNITFPNSTIEQVNLSNLANINFYNVSYFLPNLPGSYTLLFFGNDSSNNLNKTESVTITGTDSIKPKVFDLLPISNASYNVSDVIEISTNVTDNYLVSLVSANITLPNGSVSVLSLSNHSTYVRKYNNTYTIPALTGQYNVTFIANDSSNNFNKTETTFFVSTDVIKPNLIGILPFSSRTYTNNNVVEISANVTDNVEVSLVTANITYPNSSVFKLSLNKQSSTEKYNYSFTTPTLYGQYNLIFFANDTSNNINNSELTNFYVNDTTPPKVFNLTPNGGSFAINNSFEIGANFTDDSNLTFTKVNITFPNSTIEQVNLSNLANINFYNVSYFLPNLPGSYTLLFFGNDSSNNLNKTESVTITGTDSIKPKVFDLLPTVNSIFNVSNVIQIATTVTDNYLVDKVYANLSYPNGSNILYSLSNDSNHISKYNFSFTIPAVVGKYNITFIANDSSNNKNITGRNNFTVNDVVAPKISGPQINSSSIIPNVTIKLNASISDDLSVSEVRFYVQPYGNLTAKKTATDEWFIICNATNACGTNRTGVYNWTSIWANDSSRNINSSALNLQFNVTMASDQNPAVTLISPTASYTNTSNDPINISFVCNVNDDYNLKNLSLYLTNSSNQFFVLNQTTVINGTTNQSRWNVSGVLLGDYTWNCLSYDNSTIGNFDWGINRTISISAPVPESGSSSSSSGGGGGGGGRSSRATAPTTEKEGEEISSVEEIVEEDLNASTEDLNVSTEEDPVEEKTSKESTEEDEQEEEETGAFAGMATLTGEFIGSNKILLLVISTLLAVFILPLLINKRKKKEHHHWLEEVHLTEKMKRVLIVAALISLGIFIVAMLIKVFSTTGLLSESTFNLLKRLFDKLLVFMKINHLLLFMVTLLVVLSSLMHYFKKKKDEIPKIRLFKRSNPRRKI